MELATLPIEIRKPKKDDDSRILEFVGSTNHVDRMGDIVEQNWDLTPYRKNPVFLWGHDYSDLPLGKAVRIWRDSVGKAAKEKAKKALLFKIAFAPADLHPFAEQVRGLYEAGFLSATSVGFRPLERKKVDEKMREELGLGPWGQVFTKSELLELSGVTVPANPHALKKGMLTDAFGDKAGGLFFDLFKGVEVPRDEIAERYYSGMDEAGLRQFLDATELAIGELGEPNIESGTVPLMIDDDQLASKLADIPEDEAISLLSSYFAEKSEGENDDEEEVDAAAAGTQGDDGEADDTETKDGEEEIETDLDDLDEDTEVEDEVEAKDGNDDDDNSVPGDGDNADPGDENDGIDEKALEDRIVARVVAALASLQKSEQPGDGGEHGQPTDGGTPEVEAEVETDLDGDLEGAEELLSDAEALSDLVGASE